MAKRSLIRSAAGPASAPHAPLVRELLSRHLPALDRRLRVAQIELLVARILVIEHSPVPLVELEPPGQLALLANRIGQVLEFARTHQLEIAGFEFIETTHGRKVVYDVNTNTNYNPDVEKDAPNSGPGSVAAYLKRVLESTRELAIA